MLSLCYMVHQAKQCFLYIQFAEQGIEFSAAAAAMGKEKVNWKTKLDGANSWKTDRLKNSMHKKPQVFN